MDCFMRVIITKGDRGLGDTIERVTTVTGIKAVVDAIADKTGKDCGCAKRKELLNQKFPYK